MASPTITPINWVRAPSLWLRVQQFFKWDGKKIIPYLKPNPFAGIEVPHLDQWKDGACVTFWFYSAVMHNVWLKFTSEDAMKSAIEAKATDWAMAWQIGQLMAKAYNLSLVTFDNPFDKDAQEALDLWYVLACSTRFHTKFYADGVRDGRVDTEYERKSTNKKEENQIMLHFMVLKKDLKTGKYLFRNSWGKYVEMWFFNDYEVDMKILSEKNLLTRDCFLIA